MRKISGINLEVLLTGPRMTWTLFQHYHRAHDFVGTVSSPMHVITRKRLNDFADQYPESRTALTRWYRIAKTNQFWSFAELKQMFATADQVGKFTVFNVGGNKVRIIAAIHYNRHRIYIRAVLTHAEYDRGKWKE